LNVCIEKRAFRMNKWLFLNNEEWNIKDVSQSLPAVKCFYTPHGMTRQAWEKAMAKFGMDTDNTDGCNGNGCSVDGGARIESKATKRKNSRK
jgi:hypothetical protein